MPPTVPAPPRTKADYRPPLGKGAVWLAVLLSLATVACGLFDSVEVAGAEVEEFHSRFNNGQYHEIYLEADEMLQRATTETYFGEFMGAVRRKLGNLEEATRGGFYVRWGGGGKWVTLSYQSRFTHGEAVEEFVWRIDADKAKLAGYNINSPDLILR
jgi:hypothetical protein